MSLNHKSAHLCPLKIQFAGWPGDRFMISPTTRKPGNTITRGAGHRSDRAPANLNKVQ